MSIATYFNRLISGPGSLPNQYANDSGDVVLTQTTTLTTTADGLAVSATIVVPADAQLIDIILDTMVAPNAGGGSATTAPITVGTTAAGTQYSSGVDMFAGGRARPTFTTAQLAAMADVNNNTNVVFTVDPNGTISTTQGVFRGTILYRQTV